MRGDLRSASICTLLANVNRDPKRRPQPYSLSDFMLFKEAEKKRDEKELVAPETVAFLYAVAKKETDG